MRAVVAAPGKKEVNTASGLPVRAAVGNERTGVGGRKDVMVETKGHGGNERAGDVDGRAFMKTTRGGNSLSCDRCGFAVEV